MKICKNCAHAAKVDGWYCRKDINVVTGDAIACRIVREDTTKCGPDGNWYEKRFDPTDSVSASDRRWYTTKPSAIETPTATIRKETDRPWEKGEKRDYEPE